MDFLIKISGFQGGKVKNFREIGFMKSVNYRLMYQDKERAARKGGSFPLFLQEQMATLAVSLLVGSLSVYRKRPAQGRAMIAPLSSLVQYSSLLTSASEASVSGRSLRAAGAGAERAPAARRRRNTPGGPPAQGPSAPERASRPEGEGRAGQGEASARRGRDGGDNGDTQRATPEPPQPYNNLSFV